MLRSTDVSQSQVHFSMAEWLGDGQSSVIPVGNSLSTTHEREIDAHSHLFLTDQPQTHMYQVMEGVIGCYNMLPDGRRQIVTFYYPGDLIGVERTGHWQHYGEALCASKVRSISIDTVDRLIQEEPSFGQALVGALALELNETRDQLLSLGRKSALEKLSTFLLRISRRNKRELRDEGAIFLPMKRSEIADYLGMTIETVSRCLTKLKKLNVIHLDGNNHVQIIELSKLEALALGDAKQ
jgi:CRP/FNR family transcriptional regulator